ncbi:hypothetical protein I4U23_002167 [Adineta vaga]|nr:hypothetical protein I4U23_002167 [Adineta vaga]
MSMLTSSEKFPEEFTRVQQQFKEWPVFDQLCAIVELTRTFQLSYRHFLAQLFRSQILNENNDMFKHIVDDANAPDIVSCLLSNTLDKILFTLQLYLPSISITTINEKLLDAYRDVLIVLDSNLASSTKFTYTEQQIILSCQQILFFIQTNPILARLTVHLPKLTQLVQTKQFSNDEQSFQPALQRFSSVRSSHQLSKVNILEDVHANLSQQLTRLDTNDSGVDLRESSLPQPLHSFLSSRSILDRTSNKHTFVGKTASSPIPEHGTLNIPVRMPLKGVLSAPSTTLYSDARQKNTNYQQLKHRSTLAKSDEDEQESQQQLNESTKENNTNPMDSSRPLGQFFSFRHRNVKNNQSSQDVSQYLCVDALATPARNTFSQPNTGMKDVPKWLKTLRLHKYNVFFSQMTYDQMMNLTIEELKELGITDGACAKILLHIKKLKERSILLRQCMVDIDNGSIDLSNVIGQLSEILSTPIRSRQLEIESNSEEDIPQLIIQILEKINQQITPSTSSDISNNLLGLFDRCYRHEAFIDNQRYLLLQWRGRLSSMLQSTGKIEFKKIQSVHSYTQQRREGKPPIRPMKSTSVLYHQNYSSPSVSLAKYNSEPQNNSLMELNFSRRPNKSPTYMHPTEEESNDSTNFQTSFSGLTSTPQRNNGAYLANNQHQALSRKASIDPHGETNTHSRTKLCKTFSDPNRIRFYNPSQLSHIQSSSSIRPQQTPPTGLFQMISTPYSQQQQRQFISRSPPSSINDTSASPLQECYPDDEQSDYYGNPNSTISISNTSESNELETSDEQRHSHTEMESFCRRMTESAINDDVHESSIDHQENVLNVIQSSNNSTDTEQ